MLLALATPARSVTLAQRAGVRPLAARAAAAFRRARRACCSASTTSSSAEPTIRTPSSSMPRSIAEAQQIFQSIARPRAERRGAATRCARCGSTTRCCIAKAWRSARQGRHGDPRARDLQGAERGRRRAPSVPPFDDKVLREWFERNRVELRRARALRLPGSGARRRILRSRGARVRARAELRHAAAMPRRACASSRAGRTPTRAELRRGVRQGARSIAGRRVARAASSEKAGARCALEAVTPARAGGLRARCAASCCRTGPTPRWPSSAPPPCARWRRSTRSRSQESGKTQATDATQAAGE